jgi:hypothetical protein
MSACQYVSVSVMSVVSVLSVMAVDGRLACGSPWAVIGHFKPVFNLIFYGSVQAFGDRSDGPMPKPR